MNSELVIKVKYGDTLRRFSVNVHANSLNMDGLRAKILDLFKFTSDTDFTLTYIDEDNDVVTLVDDNDLRDAIGQRLNPLRINVLLNSNRAGTVDTGSTENSTLLGSPRNPSHSSSHLNSGVSEVLAVLPEPLRDALTKLSRDMVSNVASSAAVPSVPELGDALSKLYIELVSKAASSAPALAELVECLSKLGLAQPGATSNAQSNGSDNLMDGKVTKEQSSSKDLGAKSKSVDPSRNNTKVSRSGKKLGLKDLGINLFEDSNEDNTVPWILASNDNGEKKLQKENMGHPNGKSIAAHHYFPSPNDHLMDLDPQPSLVTGFPPVPSIYAYGGLGFVDGDKNKKLPGSIGDSSASHGGLNPQSKCPFNGQMGVDACGALPSGGSYRVHPFKRSHSHCDNMGRIFHKGVRCDACGVYPITGPRFKSKVKEDYDLCSICFAEMGNEADYTRMDRPMSYRSSRSFKELHDPFRHTRFPRSPLSHILRGSLVKPRRPNLDARFIQDVNVLDGTLMAPSTPFTKIWRIHNNGTIPWPYGTQLVCIGGDQFDRGSVKLEIPLEGLPFEAELDIAADFISPAQPGRYISYWRLASPSGQKFGQCVWVLIQVDTSLEDTMSGSFNGLNLNLPPENSSSRKGVRIIDVNVEPVELSHNPESDPNMGAELVKPIVDEYPNKDQELNLPSNDSLLGNNGDSVSAPPEVPSVGSYPLIDLSVVPSEPPLFIDAPPFSGEDYDCDMIEQTLLKELNEMGFTQIDLNKEILRVNDYNLEQSVADLCGFSEWDPILEELEEMGFCDKEKNKKLLKKNGGSIKRVVMDLIAGEKA